MSEAENSIISSIPQWDSGESPFDMTCRESRELVVRYRAHLAAMCQIISIMRGSPAENVRAYALDFDLLLVD